MVSPSLPQDKTCKNVAEKSPVLASEKIQDAQICWHSDDYGVLGPQGCAVGGFHGKNHNNQSSVILCNPRTVTSSHSTTTPCTAHNRCRFCRITHGHTSRLLSRLAALRVDNLETSAIQPRSSAEGFSRLSRY